MAAAVLACAAALLAYEWLVVLILFWAALFFSGLFFLRARTRTEAVLAGTFVGLTIAIAILVAGGSRLYSVAAETKDTEAVGQDLAQALGVIIRGDRPLPLRCARIQAAAHNGIVRTDRGVIDDAVST